MNGEVLRKEGEELPPEEGVPAQGAEAPVPESAIPAETSVDSVEGATEPKVEETEFNFDVEADKIKERLYARLEKLNSLRDEIFQNNREAYINALSSRGTPEFIELAHQLEEKERKMRLEHDEEIKELRKKNNSVLKKRIEEI
ncbi:MAG: hypothetical protein NT155_01485 [Candidatus Staskawiczbacteria bacterium]|nr:hypothetical protein [Candidatus Staskawiczbacteria bacterium]